MKSERTIPAAADLYGDLLDVAPSMPLGWRAYFPGLLLTAIASLAVKPGFLSRLRRRLLGGRS
jgi:hypothetical protein